MDDSWAHSVRIRLVPAHGAKKTGRASLGVVQGYPKRAGYFIRGKYCFGKQPGGLR